MKRGKTWPETPKRVSFVTQHKFPILQHSVLGDTQLYLLSSSAHFYLMMVFNHIRVWTSTMTFTIPTRTIVTLNLATQLFIIEDEGVESNIVELHLFLQNHMMKVKHG